ncbi:hypothetical protein ACUODJ_38885, partial [Escherichia sp. HC-CC]
IESLEHINLINESRDKNEELKDTVDFYKQKADALSKDVDDIQLEESSMNYIGNQIVNVFICYVIHGGFLKLYRPSCVVQLRLQVRRQKNY